MPGSTHRLSVALIEPEIPQNTGTIGRSCLALGAKLHLVRPLGFQLTAQKLRRSGLDYWQHVDPVLHDSLQEFLAGLTPDRPLWFFSTRASQSIFDVRIEPESMLIFGAESTGLPAALLERFPQRLLHIPMDRTYVRSLNLGNAVTVALYEAWRQNHSG